MHHYVYLIWHNPTSRYYIGARSSTTSPDLDTSYWGSSKYLKEERRANPEGWLKFILEEFPSRPEALDAEAKYIAGHLGNGVCINRSGGGSSWRQTTRKGARMSEDARRRIGEANRTKGPLYRQRLSAASTAMWQRPGHREHVSALLKSAARGRNPMQYAITVAVRSSVPFSRWPRE